MKRLITLIAILLLLLLTACSESNWVNPEFPAAEESSKASSAPAINNSAFGDLGKTLGELIDKYGAVTKIDSDYSGGTPIHFASTNIIFFMQAYEFSSEKDITSFSNEDLSKRNSGSLSATVTDIFPDVKSEITDEELGTLYNLKVFTNHSDEGYPNTFLNYNGYDIYIHPKTLGKINPTDTVHVKIEE